MGMQGGGNGGKQGGGKPRPYNTTASQADSFYLANHCGFCASVPACNLARPSAISPATFVSAVCRATRRAFLMALAFERPSEMLSEPLTPSSCPPPYSAWSTHLNTWPKHAATA